MHYGNLCGENAGAALVIYAVRDAGAALVTYAVRMQVPLSSLMR